jgi:5'-nucleotidase
MNRRVFIRNTAIGTAGILTGAFPYETLAADDFSVVTILHTNDLHSHIEPFDDSNANYAGKGGFARISAVIKNIRKNNPNTLVFDAGDSFQGTPYFNYYGGELIYRLMSAAGYDAATIGNHEFDNGLEGLKESLGSARFPIISSNYDFSDTILNGRFPRWKIFRKAGINVGVYGLGIELNGLVSPVQKGNTAFLDPIKTALEMESFLKNEKECDLVICISHLGLRYRENRISDVILAEETYHTDLIVGGHTHSFLESPLTLKNKKGQPIVVNQAWWGGLVLGKVDFIFERRGKKKENVLASNLKQ